MEVIVLGSALPTLYVGTYWIIVLSDRIVLIFRNVGPFLVLISQKCGPYLVLKKDFSLRTSFSGTGIVL